jgi:23S rRNA pseudouridine2457 synthase
MLEKKRLAKNATPHSRSARKVIPTPSPALTSPNHFAQGPPVLAAFHKPWGVLSQFTSTEPGHRTLAEFGFPRDVYPIGRLDADSEGLLLLSDDPKWNARLLHPSQAHPREYWAQVEGIPSQEALDALAGGVLVQGRKTLPARAWRLEPAPVVPPRNPPIRFRKSVPDSWIALELTEGRNRQVRRMTAAVGHPTLRLLRARIGGFELGSLAPGCWRVLSPSEEGAVLLQTPRPPHRSVSR